MKRTHGILLLVSGLTAALCAEPASAQTAWMPPLGTPNPPFGISDTAPPAPNPWNVPVPNFYHVNASSPVATDSANPFGSAVLPRKTIPLSLPAGAVVELHGTYSTPHRSPSVILSKGTVAAPVFIRGASPTTKPVITREWAVTGSYVVLENLEFALQDAGPARLAIINANHAAIRHSDVHGNLDGGGIGVWGSDATPATHAVIYDNAIHDNGDVNDPLDQDIHGIVVGARVNNLWVVDNRLYGNSGDGIQINAGSSALQASTHHIYVGRNVAHNNKQTGFWTKQAVDVIFSENLSYAHRPSSSSGGACMGFQYAPERVWFLFNHIHNCEFGIVGSSDSGQGFGQESFFIGNVIHDIHTSGMFNPNTSWSNSAIMLAGGVKRYLLNNTIYDVDGGINSPGSAGALHIVDNVISTVTQTLGSHIFLEMASVTSASTMYNNLLEGSVRIKWGSSRAHNLSGFQAAFPGQGLACLNADPEFVDPLNEDFHLQATSPAVDAGATHPVYSSFLSRYGIDISEDPDGTPRPNGPAFDMGAYEEAGTPPEMFIGDVSVKEGNRETVNAVFTVSLSFPSSRTVTVNYATADGTATAGSDYAAGSGTLIFPPGATTRSLVVAVKGDKIVEPDESFYVDLSGAKGATVTDGQGGGTILNDDLFSLAINHVSLPEGNSGTVNAVFTVTLSAAASGPVTVGFATANGSAISGTDYAATSGTVVFAPGSTSQTITVPVNGDTLVELNETFFVKLTSPTNAIIMGGKGQGLGTILNDDGASKAILLGPAPGSTFTSSAVTFQWSAGSEVTEYWLVVTANGGQIYSASQGTSLSRTVSGLPTNGSNVHVRLRSRIAGLWQYNDYVYKAALP